jgi:Na+-translocating ferredoxin:NAD+ oxidoreductase RnfD subunit
LLTAVLRQATGIETFSFVLLLMNITVPLLDKFILPKPFGYKKSKQGGAKK